MPRKPSEQNEPQEKEYILLRGTHIERERDEDGNIIRDDTYNPGDKFTSKRDLITMFGANTFKLVSDDKAETKVGTEEFKRTDQENRAKAASDDINKMSSEEADKHPTKVPYREDAGFEQTPPQEELDNPEDKRKKDLDLPAKRTSAERTSPSPKDKKEE